uniref:Uncharacterized protein n=1 Tax=Gasterosteus aculeatus aculeatus TaxID=481459 RepID=A0AAQ4S651_GASAC
MNQAEDPEDGVRPSEAPLCGEHDSQTTAQRIHQRPGPGPEPRCVNMERIRSTSPPLDFKDGPSVDASVSFRSHQQRGKSPEPTCVSMKSDRSNERWIDFKDERRSYDPEEDQESSEVPSAQQHQTHLDSIFMLLEENILTFVKNELKKIQKIVGSDYPECSEKEVGEVLDEEQMRSREAFKKISVHFLRRMKQEELADRLQSRLLPADCQRELKSNLKKKFQCVFEGDRLKQETHPF